MKKLLPTIILFALALTQAYAAREVPLRLQPSENAPVVKSVSPNSDVFLTSGVMLNEKKRRQGWMFAEAKVVLHGYVRPETIGENFTLKAKTPIYSAPNENTAPLVIAQTPTVIRVEQLQPLWAKVRYQGRVPVYFLREDLIGKSSSKELPDPEAAVVEIPTTDEASIEPTPSPEPAEAVEKPEPKAEVATVEEKTPPPSPKESFFEEKQEPAVEAPKPAEESLPTDAVREPEPTPQPKSVPLTQPEQQPSRTIVRTPDSAKPQRIEASPEEVVILEPMAETRQEPVVAKEAAPRSSVATVQPRSVPLSRSEGPFVPIQRTVGVQKSTPPAIAPQPKPVVAQNEPTPQPSSTPLNQPEPTTQPAVVEIEEPISRTAAQTQPTPEPADEEPMVVEEPAMIIDEEPVVVESDSPQRTEQLAELNPVPATAPKGKSSLARNFNGFIEERSTWERTFGDGGGEYLYKLVDGDGETLALVDLSDALLHGSINRYLERPVLLHGTPIESEKGAATVLKVRLVQFRR